MHTLMDLKFKTILKISCFEIESNFLKGERSFHYIYSKDLIDINWSEKKSGIDKVKKLQAYDFYKYPYLF